MKPGSANTPPPPDAAERQRALDPSRSFIVQAPAGSGKTELLIQRYLKLLGTVNEPEEIVAITFTRKAAAEMRQRVLRKLAGQGNPLADNPSRLRIQTIDSLCASLARQMPVLSRFGALPETIDDATELYQAAALATLGLVEEAGTGPAARAAPYVERLLDHLDNDLGRIAGLVAGMLASRDHWIRHLARIDRGDLEAALEAERERVCGQVKSLYPGKSAGNGAGGTAAWQALAESLITKDGGWRKRSPEGKGYFEEGESREPLRRLLATICNLPPPHYTDAQAEVLEAIAGLLPHAIAQLKLVFQARGQVDFTEVAQGALQALGEEGAPTDLALALDYRIRHLLIDEFQDTSISQFELIERLTEGWEAGDGRTVFAVGDPMQSIYRFREAEVGLFLQARRNGIGTVALEPIALRANFRSQAGIVGWVNEAFSRVMPQNEDVSAGAVAYGASEAVLAQLDGVAVNVHAFVEPPGSNARDREAARVVEIVRQVQTQAQAAADETVAILVRTRGHLSEIVPKLKEAGLAFRAVEIEQLVHRPVVQDLLALTHALGHPADRLAWLSVLRAPWCGLTLEDLVRLAEDNDDTVLEMLADDSRLARVSADGRARIARTAGVLRGCVAGRLRGSLRDAVEGAWLALGGPACVADETDLEDAALYLDHLEAHEEAGGVGDAFDASLAKLYALPDVQAGERLQIMTIHKAKGLEFDHVILPGLGRVPRNDDKKLFLWTETAGRSGPAQPNPLLIAPIQEAGAEPEPIYAWLQGLEAAKANLEAGRLLYVAATRARKRLHLLGEACTKDGAVRAPASRTLLAKLWPVVHAHFDAAAPAPQQAYSMNPVTPGQPLVRLAHDWRMPPAAKAVDWAAAREEARVQDEIEFSWAGETARHVGSVVHRWLQRMADDRLEGWSTQRVEGLRALIARDLHRRGVPAAESEAAAGRAATAMANILGDERGRWLLGPREGATSELRIRTIMEGQLRTLVVDRTFTEAGVRWIVDYKTSSHEGGGVEAFLERERERYAPQLARYSNALGKARLGLYFPMLRGWKEWE